MASSGLEFSAANCYLARYGRVQHQANVWDLRGGWDTTGYFNSRNVDSAHVQEFGKLEWYGRRLFPEARSTAAISATAVAMEAWQGMQDNPYIINIQVSNIAFIQPGEKCNFRFSFVSQFNVQAESYCIVSNSVNFKSKRQSLVLAKSVVAR